MEKMIKWYNKAYGLKYVCLRYFNVAGAHSSGEIGEAHKAAVGFYKAQDSGGPVPALADPGIPGNAGTPHPTRSLKPCCFLLPWTRHTHPHRGLPPRLTPR